LDHALSNIKHVPEDFLRFNSNYFKKHIIKITVIFSNDFKIDIIALFDTYEDLNCIKEGIVPKRFL
jgi:hypothetical protein